MKSSGDLSLHRVESAAEHSAKTDSELAPAADLALFPDPDEIPNGGLVAWLQVAGGFALFFNSWGIVNTFGVFQTYYESNLLQDSTLDAISWIGSIQSFLLLGGSVISGPLFDAGYFKSLLATGTFMIGFGFMMLSLATEYWHILLSQALCIGLGAGCLVVPALAVLPQYFTTKRALVNGIAVVGSSCGGVVYPLIFQGLESKIGFAWTARILGFVAFSTCAFACLVMRQRGKPRKVRSLIDKTAFKEVPYLFYCLALFFSNFGFFVPIFYLQTYAMSHGLTDKNLALHLIAILNAASILGRLAPSYFVVRIGPVNTMMAVALLASVVTCSWIAVTTGPGNVVFAVMYGFTSGGIVSLPAVVLTSITADLSFLGARMGTANFLNAIGSLCGAPIAGAILNTTGQYLGIQLFAGFTILMTTLFLYGTRVAKAGTGLLVKV